MTAPTTTTEQVRGAWEALASGFDQYVTPQNLALGEQALDRVPVHPGSQLLDVAAGSGALSIPAARRGADVLAVDLAPGMVDRLVRRARAEGLSLTGRVMDGQSLDLEDGTFDIAVSQHGVSLFPDLAGGLAQLARVLRPGGHLLIVAFGPIQQAEFLGFFIRAVQAAGFAPPPLDPPPLPFQVSDPELLRRRLVTAGLREVQVERTTARTAFRSATHLWNAVTSSNPIAAEMAGRLSAEERTDVQAVLDGMLRERSGGAPGAVLQTAVNIGTARARSIPEGTSSRAG